MSKQPYSVWYTHSAWRRRRKRQLQQEPFCRLCLAQGRHIVATVVDHVIPHRGDHNAFMHGALQSLCESCHNSSKQQLETHGFIRDIGLDGRPVDPKHPSYTGKCPTAGSETIPLPPLDVSKLIG